MYSLNVPVPPRVTRIIDELSPLVAQLDSIREHPTLLVKRLGALEPIEFDRTEKAVRSTVTGTPTFEVAVTGIDVFREPPNGPGPVVYLAVRGSELHRLHQRLVAEFGAAEGLEGEGYVPHITLGRGGDPETIETLCDRSIESVTWTVTELLFWDARRALTAGRIPLPA
ncbi:MAG: 2'-5' RNA ligase family protein [Halobacteriales archaeon]|nr:2'-5' RNA ligase family protein [Halobacteriales archaeon]